MKSEDQALISAFRNPVSRKQAFEQIVKLYNQRLHMHLYRYFAQSVDIEDVLQNVWIKAWKGLDNFRGDSLLSTWLISIANREAFSTFRKKKLPDNISTEDVIISGNLSGPSYEKIMHLLQTAIESLPEKQKEVFVMRYFEELSYEEISQSTKTSVGGLKASYHHAVKKIEKILQAH